MSSLSNTVLLEETGGFPWYEPQGFDPDQDAQELASLLSRLYQVAGVRVETENGRTLVYVNPGRRFYAVRETADFPYSLIAIGEKDEWGADEYELVKDE